LVKGYGTEFLRHFKFFREQVTLLANYKLGMDQQRIEANKDITYYALVSTPYVADKKDSPKRVPITLIGGLSIMLLTFMILGFIEREKINS
jgi:capsule polysaccharide export protein KpsE/RkpR